MTSIPANATKTSECSTGCGSEEVTRYKFECNNGYVKSGNSCVKDCSDYTLTSCPDNAKCSQCDGKYKLENCNDGYYKVIDTHAYTTWGGSDSEQKYECHHCGGTLVGKSDNCPAGTLMTTKYGAVDNTCCTTCSDDYNLDECPEHATCLECGGKYKFQKCDDGYYQSKNFSITQDTTSSAATNASIECIICNGEFVASSTRCPGNRFGYPTTDGRVCCPIVDCSDHNLTSCPANTNCSECKGKYKITSCKPDYTFSQGACVVNSSGGSGGGGATQYVKPCDDLSGMDRCCCLLKLGAINSTGSSTGVYHFELAGGAELSTSDIGCGYIDRAACGGL